MVDSTASEDKTLKQIIKEYEMASKFEEKVRTTKALVEHVNKLISIVKDPNTKEQDSQKCIIELRD